MAKRKRLAGESLAVLSLQDAIEEAETALILACECDGRGCRLCIAADNLRRAASREEQP